MFNEMVLYHFILIEILLAVSIIGFTIPILSKNYNLVIKRMRIYIFVFHGLIASVAFSGLVAFIFAKMELSLTIYAMILAFITIPTIESIKYLKILKTDNIKAVNIKYSIINISILLAFTIWKLGDYKSAVSIP